LHNAGGTLAPCAANIGCGDDAGLAEDGSTLTVKPIGGDSTALSSVNRDEG